MASNPTSTTFDVDITQKVEVPLDTSDIDSRSRALEAIPSSKLNFKDGLLNATAATHLNITKKGADCFDDREKWADTQYYVVLCGTLFLLIAGTIGNTVAYFVLKRKSYRKNVMAGALRYLAVLDNIILWTLVMEMFLKTVYGFDLPERSYEHCILYSFYVLCIKSIDYWLLVMITATRLINLMFPLKSHKVCSRLNYYGALVLMHIGIICAHGGVQLSIYNDLPAKPDQTLKEAYHICYYFVQEKDLANPSLVVVTITVNFVAPSVLLIVFSVMMVRELKKMERRRKTMSGLPRQTLTDTSMENTSQNALLSCDVINIRMACTSKDQQNRRKEFDLNLQNVDDVKINASGVRMVANNTYKFNGTNQTFFGLLPSGLASYLPMDPHPEPVARRTTTFSQNTESLASQYKRDEEGRPCIHDTFAAINNVSNNANQQHTGDPQANLDVTVHKNMASSTVVTGTSAETRTKLKWVDKMAHSLRAPVTFDVGKLTDTSADPGSRTDNTGTGSREGVYPSASATANGDFRDMNQIRASRVNSLTYLLIAASLIFLILNVQFWTFHFVFGGYEATHKIGCTVKGIILQVAFMIKFTNHAVNFYLYCATGTRFRYEFKLWLRSLCRKKN